MAQSWGTCNSCHKNRPILNRRHGLCKPCNSARLEKRAMEYGGHKVATGLLKQAVAPSKRKEIAEGAFLKAVAASRPHICFVCGQKIPDITYSSAAHVLNKKNFGKFRLYDKNIVLLCPPQCGCRAHYKYDFTPHSTLRHLPEWQKLFKLRDELMDEYNQI